MPAHALPPPTSPYLQALQRASGKIIKHQQRVSEGTYEDGLGDVCWVCGNATRESQAYCSNTCRDSDSRIQDDLYPSGNILEQIDHLQLSPAVSAVPALVPSTSAANGHSSGASRRSKSNPSSANASGSSTPHAQSRRSSAHRISSNMTAINSAPPDQAQTGNGSGNGNRSHPSKNSNARTNGTISSGGGTTSSSSPPSSSATSSPATKTADDDDHHHLANPSHHIEEDIIENLLLPPPAVGGHGSPNKKQQPQLHHHHQLDYAYPYAVRAGGLVVPKSPPSSHVRPNSSQGGLTSSTAMRKSASSQNNRLHLQNKLTSPILGPKSVGAIANIDPSASTSSSSRPTTSQSASLANTQHDVTTTPPLNPSEVITFRRRHYAPDSMNGHQKSSHGVNGHVSGNGSTATSSSASPALKAIPTSSSSNSNSNVNSRRHSSHGSSHVTSPIMLPAFSPLVKAQSTTSRSIPTVHDDQAVIASPKLHAADAASSTSLAADKLSNLLQRTTSKSDKTVSVNGNVNGAKMTLPMNRRASKSDSLLANIASSGPTVPSPAPSPNTRAQVSSMKQGQSTSSSSSISPPSLARPNWLQRNKLTKTFFSFNGPLSSSSLTGRMGESQLQPHAHATCARKNCPVNHAAAPNHPLSNFFTPLSRRSSEPGSPFASPAIYYTDAVDPFEESFSKSAGDSISASGALKSSNVNTMSAAANAGVRRRPSLSTSVTSPAVITSPSPGVNGVKPQDYSGFAGFLFALHNQRKSSTSGNTSLPLSSNGQTSAAANARGGSFDLQGTPDSSESGYDAQDEEHLRVDLGSRGRGRSSRRNGADNQASTTALFKSDVPLPKSAGQQQTSIVKPAQLREKLQNVVKASNDRSASPATGAISPEPTSTADVSPARSNHSGKPRGFLFSRGNAFKNSALSNGATSTKSADNSEEEVEEVRIQPDALKKTKKSVAEEVQVEDVPVPAREAVGRGRKPETAMPRPRHNHSTSVGEGSQYIVSLQGMKRTSSEEVDDASSEELVMTDGRESPDHSPARGRGNDAVAQQQNQARGRPTARRRSSANGRVPVVSPFTTLERAHTFAKGEEQQQQLQSDDAATGRGRSRARGSAALHRSVSPARSSSRARGRDSPRLRNR